MYFIQKKLLLLLSFLVLICLLTVGCSSLGPRKINSDRGLYDDAIRNTNQEQLLKNIVRLRYVEPVSFLKVTNVTASYTILNEGDTNGGLNWAGSPGTAPVVHTTIFTRFFGFLSKTSYSNTPTISYVPVENADFVNELLKPITLQQLMLLYSGGNHDLAMLLRLVVQSVNQTDNASNISSSKMAKLPHYSDYYKLLVLLSMKLEQEHCTLLPKNIDKNFVIAMHCMKKNSGQSIYSREIRTMLGLDPNSRGDIILSDNYVPNHSKNVAYVQLRSIYGIMAYLSFGVQVPPEDIAAGYVYQYYYSDGRPFDWGPLLQGIMQIDSSIQEPKDVFVKIYFHKHWFFIRNTDLDSKSTFSLVSRLLTLTAGGQLSVTGASLGPIIAVPAGRAL